MPQFINVSAFAITSKSVGGGFKTFRPYSLRTCLTCAFSWPYIRCYSRLYRASVGSLTADSSALSFSVARPGLVLSISEPTAEALIRIDSSFKVESFRASEW